jgi:hypothetical protein
LKASGAIFVYYLCRGGKASPSEEYVDIDIAELTKNGKLYSHRLRDDKKIML